MARMQVRIDKPLVIPLARSARSNRRSIAAQANVILSLCFKSRFFNRDDFVRDYVDEIRRETSGE